MAICNPTETISSRQNPSQQKYSRKSAQNFRKPTVILQHLQLKAGKQSDAAVVWVAIQFSSLDRGEKTWTRKEDKIEYVQLTGWCSR